VVSVRAVLRRLLGGEALPDGFSGRLEADERVLATARTADGAHLVVTSWGLWIPEQGLAEGDAVRRIGWHLVSRGGRRAGRARWRRAAS
jgi:hypothetical protein